MDRIPAEEQGYNTYIDDDTIDNKKKKKKRNCLYFVFLYCFLIKFNNNLKRVIIISVSIVISIILFAKLFSIPLGGDSITSLSDPSISSNQDTQQSENLFSFSDDSSSDNSEDRDDISSSIISFDDSDAIANIKGKDDDADANPVDSSDSIENANQRYPQQTKTMEKKVATTQKPERQLSYATQGLRNTRSFLIVSSQSAKSKSTHHSHSHQQQQQQNHDSNINLSAALKQLGYKESTGNFASDKVLWILSHQMKCNDPLLSSTLNTLSDSSGIILFCQGSKYISQERLRKDTIYNQLMQFDERILSSSALRKKCMRVNDFLPITTIVYPNTDLRKLEEMMMISSKRGSQRSYILKTVDKMTKQKSAFPLVTSNILPGLKKLQKHKGFQSLLFQLYQPSPLLLWDRKKFSIHPWAILTQSSANELVVFYHDGMTIKSLDEYDIAKTSVANITTHQNSDSRYMSQRQHVHGCLKEFQNHISQAGHTTGGVLDKLVSDILRPHLKSIMATTIFGLREDFISSSSSSFSQKSQSKTVQYICFNFMIDDDWKIHLHDVTSTDDESIGCSLNPGGDDFISDCKIDLRRGLGKEVIEKLEILMDAGNTLGDNDAIYDKRSDDTLEILIDERSNKGSKQASLEKWACNGNNYEQFRIQQVRAKKVIMNLLPHDGYPTIKSQSLHDHFGQTPWKCQSCGYMNDNKASLCDRCGKLGNEDAIPKEKDAGRFKDDEFNNRNRMNHNDEIDSNEFGRETNIITRRMKNEQFDTELNALEDNQRRSFHASDTFNGDNINNNNQQRMNVLNCLGRSFKIVDDIDTPGNDIEVVRTSSVTACCAACANLASRNDRSACRGFSFIPAKFDCWLKSMSDTSSQIRYAGVISGYLM